MWPPLSELLDCNTKSFLPQFGAQFSMGWIWRAKLGSGQAMSSCICVEDKDVWCGLAEIQHQTK